MVEWSVLFQTSTSTVPQEQEEEPDFFQDLNLDQIFKTITIDKTQYRLLSLYQATYPSIERIYYRQQVSKDLEKPDLYEAVKRFEKGIYSVRDFLTQSEKRYNDYQKESWFLDAVEQYCSTVRKFSQDMKSFTPVSAGLRGIGDFVNRYVQSEYFSHLEQEVRGIRASLATIHYTILVRGGTVRVRKHEGEADYTTEVEASFEKFQTQSGKDYLISFVEAADMNSVEEKILLSVARLYPEIFHQLSSFYTANQDFQDETIITFDREVQFYLAYLEHIKGLKEKGYLFCYPQILEKDKNIGATSTFDLALADRLLKENQNAVANSFYLKDPERILVVSGPNQGGKTTFARMMGQLHYLASLGLPIPGSSAKTFLFDKIYTHFQTEEDIRNLQGKLQNDLYRAQIILNGATERSLIIVNEIFSSTTMKDALFLAKKIFEKILALDAITVCVTFLDELSRLGPQTVSMVSTVVPETPSIRTFKIIRKPADGLAYAIFIAEKYSLTYQKILERLPK